MISLTKDVRVACEDTSCSVIMRCWQFNSEETFNRYMSKRVRDRLLDVDGTQGLATYYDAVTLTGFSDERLKNIFSHNLDVKLWRIGEALAECFLEDTEDISFPWNGKRDQKVEGTSPPGADLVGFKGNGPKVKFLFGEVKTSSDNNHPPNVMYGRSGMTQQLESLKTSCDRRGRLVVWFAWRAKGEAWESDFKTALITYYKSNECVFLQGVLVRDTQPDIRDLKSRGLALDRKKPAEMEIKLYGICCPSSIDSFPALVRGGVES